MTASDAAPSGICISAVTPLALIKVPLTPFTSGRAPASRKARLAFISVGMGLLATRSRILWKASLAIFFYLRFHDALISTIAPVGCSM